MSKYLSPGVRMQLNIIKDYPSLEALSDEWNALLKHSASHVPFLRHEYICAWWRHLGGGEWPQGDLYVVTARDLQGRLLGIAPLFYTRNLMNEPALLLIGSLEISDYLDLIVRPEHLQDFIESLLNHLASREAPAWQALDLYNILESSPTLGALESASLRRGWKFKREHLSRCPYIPLPGDWEAYLSGIDKKQRHEIRRKIRRAEQNQAPVRFYIVENGDEIESEVEALLSLMATDPEKERMLTPARQRQMHDLAKSAFEEGWLQLAFMEVDSEKAAGYINFDFQDRIWVYNSGIDTRFRELSPGWVLLSKLIEWANLNGRQIFDMMRGDEQYKYRFGAVDANVWRVVIRC
jgi:CelD/BcsL family acetyltransferase involved in cellulose biosynthesis